MRDNPLVAIDVHDVIGCQVLHVHEGKCRDERLAVTQMLIVFDDLCLDVLAMQASPSSQSGQGQGSTARLPCFAPWHSSLQGQSEQVRAALRIPQGQRNALLTTELALGTIDCNPAHHWHNAVVPSPRHSVSRFPPFSLPLFT